MDEFDLYIGAQVHCLDGECGKLAKIALDPISLHVTDLIVEEGLLLKQARVFPLSTVIYTEPEDIILALASEELLGYPEYRETVLERPATGWDGRSGYKTASQSYPSLSVGHYPSIAPTTIKEKIHQGLSSEAEVVAKGTLVKNLDGIVGRLSHLMTDPETGAITHLVVHQGLLFPEFLDIPVSYIESISQEGVFLPLTYEELYTFKQPKNLPS